MSGFRCREYGEIVVEDWEEGQGEVGTFVNLMAVDVTGSRHIRTATAMTMPRMPSLCQCLHSAKFGRFPAEL